jgi:hypothetical protein
MKYERTRGNVEWIGLRALVAVGAVLAVAACTSMKAHSGDNYERGNATSEKYYKDTRACDKQAEAHGKEHGFGPYDPTNAAYNRMFDACMASSGYTVKKAVE